MMVRERLKGHKTLLKKIQNTEKQIDMLEEGLSSPRVSNPERTAVQGGEQTDYTPQKLMQIDEIKKELKKLCIQRDHDYPELKAMVDTLENQEEVTILQSYYFLLLSRHETAEHLYGKADNVAADEHQRNRVSRIHSRAMNKLEKAEKQLKG